MNRFLLLFSGLGLLLGGCPGDPLGSVCSRDGIAFAWSYPIRTTCGGGLGTTLKPTGEPGAPLPAEQVYAPPAGQDCQLEAGTGRDPLPNLGDGCFDTYVAHLDPGGVEALAENTLLCNAGRYALFVVFDGEPDDPSRRYIVCSTRIYPAEGGPATHEQVCEYASDVVREGWDAGFVATGEADCTWTPGEPRIE